MTEFKKIIREHLTYRIAGLEDIDLLIEYRIKFLNEISEKESNETEKKILIDSMKEYFSAAVPDKTFVAYIAEYEGAPVSFGGLVIRRQPGNYSVPMGKTGYILSMYTLPEYRKNGIGSLIFQKLIDYSNSINLDRLELHAAPDGEPIYRKFGFNEPHHTWLELKLK